MMDSERARLHENLTVLSEVLALARDMTNVERLRQRPERRIELEERYATLSAAAARAPEATPADVKPSADAMRAAQKAYRRLSTAIEARLGDARAMRGAGVMSAPSRRLADDAASLADCIDRIRSLLDV